MIGQNEPVENLPAIDYRSKCIPLEKIIELYQKGLTQVEIAKFFGCTKQAIHQRISPFKEDLEALPSFKSFRADVLAFHQRRILSRLTEDDLKKASGYQKVGMFGILYDKERLERGETTQNIGYADYSKSLAAVMEKRQQLEAELGLDDTVSSEDGDVG